MSHELETKKLDLLARMRIKYSGMPETDHAKLHRGLMNVPAYQITMLAEYLHDELLPSIDKQRGRDSDQYKRFSAMEDAMNWCIYTLDLHERTMLLLSNERLMVEYLQERVAFYHHELLRYTTAEDLLMGETFMASARALGRRAIDNIEATPLEAPVIETNPFNDIIF